MDIPVLTKLRALPPVKKKACAGVFFTYTRKRWRKSSVGYIWTESLRLIPSQSCPGCYVCRRMLAWMDEHPDKLRLPDDRADWAHLEAVWGGRRRHVDLVPVKSLPPRRRKDLKTVKKGV